MELYREILCNMLQKESVEVYFPQLESQQDVVESVCYRALEKIRDIIRDATLEDEECFSKIEEIVCVLEEIGSNGGQRHDFG